MDIIEQADAVLVGPALAILALPIGDGAGLPFFFDGDRRPETGFASRERRRSHSQTKSPVPAAWQRSGQSRARQSCRHFNSAKKLAMGPRPRAMCKIALVWAEGPLRALAFL